MTTYYHGGGEIQVDGGGDNLQTLYLMNPNSYITSTPYSDNHHHPLLLNTTIIPQPSSNPHQQQFSGIPLAGPHQNWSPTSEGIPTQVNGLVHNSLGHTEFKSPGPHTAQGNLSLSLSPGRKQDVRMSVTVASGSEVIIKSKYLRSTQELLEEVVNVVGLCDNGASRGVDRDNKAKSAVKVDDDVVRVGHYGGTGEDASGSSNKGAELSTVHRHELQMKKAKLLNMLDEVEQRYRQYHNQMQLVASSFEQAAGIGSAKSYTSLALKTISKQFRCLKDAITSQIKSASKSLGEDDNVGRVKLEGGAGSRLRLVDQELRQQRALQQFRMMHQHNAWRPQRGLPERAVTVLRAWLFEHFLHPYPKDSDKHMLAKQTGLTRSQVSNWFINARVRLWKPMVEEMYVEEMKSHEENGGGTSENNTNTATMNMITTNDGGVGNFTLKNENNRDDHKATKENGAFNNMIVPTHQHEDNQQNTNDMISTISQSQGFNTLIGSSSNMETLMTSQKKQRSNNSSNMNSPSSILSMDMEMKPIDHQHQKYVHQEHQKRHHNPSMMNTTTSQIGFNPYIVNDIGRFDPGEMTPSYHGNAVSLTLGLPRCDNYLSMSDNHQQNFFPNQDLDMGRRLNVAQGEDFCGISMGQTSHSSNGYESIDIQNRKRFAAQILHDFVA